MTATSHNGIKVLEDRPVTAPILNPHTGEPILWPQQRQLLLEDGSTVYGCVHCDATFEKKASVRPHLKAHSNRAAEASSTPLSEQERTIAVLGKELDRAERKAARAIKGERAAKAETRRVQKELDTLRAILTPSAS